MIILTGSVFSVWSCLNMVLDCLSLQVYREACQDSPSISTTYFNVGLFIFFLPGIVAYFLIFVHVLIKDSGNSCYQSVAISLIFSLVGLLFPVLPFVWLYYHAYKTYQKKEMDNLLVVNLLNLMVVSRLSSCYPSLVLQFLFLGNSGLVTSHPSYQVVTATAIVSLLTFLFCVVYICCAWYNKVVRDTTVTTVTTVTKHDKPDQGA